LRLHFWQHFVIFRITLGKKWATVNKIGTVWLFLQQLGTVWLFLQQLGDFAVLNLVPLKAS